MSTGKDLSKVIKMLRKEHGLTQTELAEKAGIDYKYLQSLESINNTHSPTLKVLEKISKAFELETWEFVRLIGLKKK